MKYLTLDSEVKDMLDQQNIATFDPFRFDTQLTIKMLDVLQKAVERQHLSRRDPHWQRLQLETVPEGKDHRPLTYLGVGALLAAIAAIIVFAIGLR